MITDVYKKMCTKSQLEAKADQKTIFLLLKLVSSIPLLAVSESLVQSQESLVLSQGSLVLPHAQQQPHLQDSTLLLVQTLLLLLQWDVVRLSDEKTLILEVLSSPNLVTTRYIISLAHNVSFWAQKSSKWFSIVSGPRN